VDRNVAREERLGACAHRREIREIDRDEFDLAVTGRPLDLVDHGLGLRLRPTREDHVGPRARELGRRDLADPGVRAGDDEGLVRELVHVLKHGSASGRVKWLVVLPF